MVEAGSISSRTTEPWDAVLALEPEPHRILAGEQLDDALTVAADFIDLKSPYMGGHSRRCADLAGDAARVLGLDEDAITTVRRAALVHDFGTTVVPNSIWDKPGPLTRAEFDRVELHPMLTEQMLRRSPALSALNPVASAHHEKCDGSGYHKRVRGQRRRPRGMRPGRDGDLRGTDHRASRPPAHSRPQTPPPQLRRFDRPVCSSPARAGRCSSPPATASREASGRRPRNPGGLTRREVDVLRLAARGLTTRQIADRLYISPKTADHHIQHIYGKIGVVDASRGRPLGHAARRRAVGTEADSPLAITLTPWCGGLPQGLTTIRER